MYVSQEGGHVPALGVGVPTGYAQNQYTWGPERKSKRRRQAVRAGGISTDFTQNQYTGRGDGAEVDGITLASARSRHIARLYKKAS